MLQHMTWCPLQPCDESIFSTAPYVYRYPVELDVCPERVWESLTSDRALAAWGLGLHSLTWTSPRPFGVGTTREVVLPGKVLTVRERFFRWEEGSRKSFYGTEVNRPVLNRIAEDYLVEKTDSGSRFTWTIALEPTDRTKRLLQIAAPVNKLTFHAVPIRARKYFAKHP
jgi:uncharacterized protein YndB with AHSA1/START domain